MQKNSKMVHYEVIQNCLVIYISNDLDHHTVTLLRDYSDRLIEAGNIRHIVFDFTDVDFMDSSGIGLIMGRNVSGRKSRSQPCRRNGKQNFRAVRLV